jgi:phosphatidylserine decarboxylase
MKIHTAGIIPILIMLAGVLLILIVVNHFFPEQTRLHYLLYAAGFIYMALVVRFFRYPGRITDAVEHGVYSGADGEVVAIEKVYVDEYFADERIQVSVFMSIFDVHINWSPSKGKVVYHKHHRGRHMVAFNPKSSLLNEHTSMVIRDDQGREVMMRQIAGAVARRIISKPRVGSNLTTGEVIGMIKFGSRIDLLLPPDAEVKVGLGDRTVGAETLMAILP